VEHNKERESEQECEEECESGCLFDETETCFECGRPKPTWQKELADGEDIIGKRIDF
jgi:hypothetical protein